MKQAATLGLLLLGTWLAGCSYSTQESAGGCTSNDECAPNQMCDTKTNLCLVRASVSPALEVWPPSQNNQGWVVHEFPEPVGDADGRLIVQLNHGVSLTGHVYASDDVSQQVQARIVAWRNSRIEGRPRVQVETSTDGKRDRQSDTFLLWLNKGHIYDFYVSPLPPNDTEYPPLVVTNLEIADHMMHDFVLDGDDRAIVVKGRIVKASGEILDSNNVVNEKGQILSSSVRVRAFEVGGLKQSTVATSDETTGEFTFKVPAGVTSYTLKVESAQGSMPIPSMECTKMVLGLTSPGQEGIPPEQIIGDIRLPSFSYARLFTVTVKGSDRSPVEGAAVTFSTTIDDPCNEGFDTCTARFERSGITDSSGKVEMLLLPGTTSDNRVYSVTILSPAKSRFASRWLKSFAVGPSAGFLAPITLDPRYRLSGTVVNKVDGQSVAGVVIEALGIDQAQDASPWPVADATTSTLESGRFDLYVDPGIYNINLRPPQNSGLPNFGLTAKIDADVANKVFEIPTPSVLPGMVLEPTGKSLPNAKVNVYELMPARENPLTTKATLRASSITDAEGLFNLILPDLP